MRVTEEPGKPHAAVREAEGTASRHAGRSGECAYAQQRRLCAFTFVQMHNRTAMETRNKKKKQIAARRYTVKWQKIDAALS